jgi:hypothetical protein
MSDVRINSRSPYFIEANATEPIQPVIPPPVGNEPPTVYIQVSNDNPYLGEVVTLTAVATDVDGTIVSYLWGGFGSGTTESITATNSSLIQDQVFIVTVTDNDGNTATAIKTISWRDEPEQIVNQGIDVNCGDIINEGTFLGTKTYNLIGVADKVGNVEIEFLDGGGIQDAPVKFDITWNGITNTTGYIGDSSYSISDPIPPPNNTTSPTNKKQPTTLVINKTASSPEAVTLTAQSLFRNDSYSFRLNCPDVEDVETFYYTLTSDCEGGSTTFTYTDVNGVIQTVVLADGESLLVSAQPNTAIVADCTGTVEQGGQSFDLGVPEQTVNINTEFVVWLDSSGSLSAEVEELKIMTDNELKSSFLKYYDDDSVLYNNQVTYVEDPYNLTGTLARDERIFKWASLEKTNASSTKLVHLIYLDEAYDKYHSGSLGDNTKPPSYLSDINELRNSLNSQTQFGNKMVVVFCIEKTEYDGYKQFSHFIDNVSTGANGFYGSNGLSDRSEVIFVRNVLPLQDSAYYHQVTIDALTALGFKI